MTNKLPVTAYIALGSNIGECEKNIDNAIDLLDQTEGVSVTKISKKIKTPPIGPQDQPDFINNAIEIKTTLPPQQLLRQCKEIELKLGRRKIRKWGERTIDLDIIFYSDKIINEDDLKIPHPEMEKRDFVLIPLAEIAPDFVHPILNKRIDKILQVLK
jgi:2-amino-4-hydroxy-6-hydroxymethyldihydropteridine diphosphokinase